MRRLAWLLGAITAVASGAYVFIYLYRWEWHRALFSAVVFLAVEQVLMSAVLLRRINQVSVAPRGADDGGPRRDPAVVARLQQARATRDHFAWLRASATRTNVFLTVLLGGGAILSGGAWLVDRIARHTTGRHVEQAIADRLTALALPPDGFVPDDEELVAVSGSSDDPRLRRLLGPGGARR